jgi:ribosomal protein L37AE/L43A
VEKYGVEEAEPVPEKTATDKPKECPKCHSPLRPTLDTGVLLCPQCGSKPFEKAGP